MLSIVCDGADTNERTIACLNQSRVIASLTNPSLSTPLLLEMYENTNIGIVGIILILFMISLILASFALRTATATEFTQPLSRLLIDATAMKGGETSPFLPNGKSEGRSNVDIPIERTDTGLNIQKREVRLLEDYSGFSGPQTTWNAPAFGSRI